MKRFGLLIISIIVLLTNSCVKKQIKNSDNNQGDTSNKQQIIQSTTNVSGISEIFGDTTNNETNVRKKATATLKTIYFDFDKYELKPESMDVLSQNAKVIIENNFSIVIEGHCDERGTEQYNLSLGQKRANVVKEYYIRLGVNPSKIATISYGEEMPVCGEKTEDCWALNRRAETKVTE